MSTTTIKCDNCLKEFERENHHIKRNERLKQHNFCCPRCQGEWQSKNRRGKNHQSYNKQEVVCYSCGKTILRNPWEIKNRKRFSCSNDCKKKIISDRYTGSGHPLWSGGKYVGKNGYIYVHDGKGKYKEEHVLIAEKVLERPMRYGEVVHHINLKKQDNRNENLIICSSSYHHQIHQNMIRQYAQVFLGG